MSTPLRPHVEFRRDLLHYVDDCWQHEYAPRPNHPVTIADIAAHYEVPKAQAAYWVRAAMKKLRWMARATALVEWADGLGK